MILRAPFDRPPDQLPRSETSASLAQSSAISDPEDLRRQPDPAGSDAALLAAIIIYSNTQKLSEAVFARQKAGLETPDEFLDPPSRRSDGSTPT